MGVLVPGGQISRKQVYSILGAVIPTMLTHQECSEVKTMLIGPIDYVRRALLAQGMYFAQEKGNYRVYKLEENVHAVKAYARRARNSCIRGQTLNDNTPAQYMKNQQANTKIFDQCINLLAKVS